MSQADVALGPRLLGGEVLTRLAVSRATGYLVWASMGTEARLAFKSGRPERAVFNNGQVANERTQVVGFVRGFAALSDGSCRFDAGEVEVEGSLGIDTLGETLVALVRNLNRSQLMSMWQARGGWEVEPTDSFDRLAGALPSVGGETVRRPLPGSQLASLIADQSVERQRSWAALLALGALKVTKTPEAEAPAPRPITSRRPTSTKAPATIPPVEATPAPGSVAEAVSRRPITGSTKPRTGSTKPRTVTPPGGILPRSAEGRALHQEIEKAFTALSTSNHYDVLGVQRVATADTIRKAYFEKAKAWHSDRFSGAGLSAETLDHAADLFRAVEEANRVLNDPDERKTYDYVIDRQARGLPTDPHVIMEAEAHFRKGAALIRKGQGAAALPLLTKAIDMNGGEPEFHVYHGFALYCARGSGSAADAIGAINKGLAMSEKLDSAHEFLGRIHRLEGKLGEAQRQLKLALELNPKNVDAARELRLLQMREQTKPAEGSIGGLFNKVFKK